MSVRKPRKVNIATGIDVIVALPEGSIDPGFVDEAIGDMKAAYERALARSWEDFERKTGCKMGGAV